MDANKVNTHDNRGDDSYAYGFVYFEDGRRVAYTQGDGVASGVTGGWRATTYAQEAAAAEYLRHEGLINE